jgi:uncharacterized DUF497 family protein
MPTFGWNPIKARRNLAKHGIDFEFAKNVFLDHAGVVEIDDSEPGEERWRIIGLVGIKLLFVVFTEVDDDVIHIISAREANKSEEPQYFGQAAP